MKHFLLLLALSCFSLSGWSQDQTRPPASKQLKATSSSYNGPASEYNFMEKKIFNILKEPQIPADFPKYDETAMTEEQYKEICLQWFRNHPELVKEEFFEKDAARQRTH